MWRGGLRVKRGTTHKEGDRHDSLNNTTVRPAQSSWTKPAWTGSCVEDRHDDRWWWLNDWLTKAVSTLQCVQLSLFGLDLLGQGSTCKEGDRDMIGSGCWMIDWFEQLEQGPVWRGDKHDRWWWLNVLIDLSSLYCTHGAEMYRTCRHKGGGEKASVPPYDGHSPFIVTG